MESFPLYKEKKDPAVKPSPSLIAMLDALTDYLL